MNHLYCGSAVGDIVLSALHRYGDRPAFHDQNGSYSYDDLKRLVLRGLSAFKALGLEPGTTIAQLSGNRIETFAFIAASFIAGMRSVALQPKAGVADNVRILQSSGAALLVADDHYESLGAELCGLCPAIRSMHGHGGDHSFWALSTEVDRLPVASAGDADSIVRLAYTGGTTGAPKGVMLSNRTMVANAMLMMCGMRWPEEPRYLCAMPMTHGAGALILPTLHKGGQIVLQREFDTKAFRAAVDQHQCNVTWLVPTALYKLLDDPGTRAVDWSRMTSMVYSAGPTVVPRIEQAIGTFGPCLVQMYGQTEAPGALLVLTQDDHRPGAARLRSAGRPFPGVRLALLGDDGQPVASGAVGEICVRGALVMDGYLHQPEATAAALQDGWLHTGDLATRDEDGYYYLVDRKKDMIITGGFNVYPLEVENVLASHPAVASCAVLGLPDPLWGEQVTAYVVFKHGMSVAPDVLAGLVRHEKGAIQTPKVVRIVDSLPLTNFGKVDKKRLKQENV